MDSSCLFYDLLAVFFFWKDFKYFPFHCLPLFFHYFLFILIPLCTRYCILYIAIFFRPSKSNYYLPPQQCNLPAGINCFYLIIFHLAFKIVLEMHLRFIASA